MARVFRIDGDTLVPRIGRGTEALEEVARAFGAPAAALLPPLWDHHGHVTALGRSFEEADLRRCLSLEEAVREVVRRASSLPPDAWVLGFGWDQNLWGGGFPHRKPLDDALPGRPVLLWRIDGHAAWASTEALRRSGLLERSSDPEGGVLLREGGSPTGILLDAAADLLRKAVPAPRPPDLERWILKALLFLADRGLSGVTDMGLEPEEVEVFRSLDREGRLPLEVRGFVKASPGEPLPEVSSAAPGRRFRFSGYKFFADGALGSRGAALLDDYTDAPGTKGLLLWEMEELRRALAETAERRLRAAVHAIGDAALRRVLDAAFPLRLGPALRIEHVQVADAEEVSRLSAAGAVASVQPSHRLSDEAWAPLRLGRRMDSAYRLGSLARAGIPLLFGTDFPIEEPDPARTLRAAVLRGDGEGLPLSAALAACAPPPGAEAPLPAAVLFDAPSDAGDPRWLSSCRIVPLKDGAP